MARNDLNQPLYRKTRKRPPRRQPVIASALVAAAILLGLVAALWVALVDDPDGGRPVAVAAIREAAPAATGSLADGAPADAGPVAASQPAIELAALPAAPPMLGADPGLVEQSAFGLLPRVSPDGRRPGDVYARRVPESDRAKSRVAIVIGGLGISQTGTQSAIEALPEEITLAFAPYGGSLRRWSSKAREEGHEILLQIPLEPHGYPQENPGEHTLLASVPGSAREDLHWVLSRMTGYAGVMNYMGARFTSDERALVPFLGEIGERGLFYLDDSSVAESRTDVVGEALRVPVLRADRIIDQSRSAADIERALSELEAIAATRGYAVGVASAFTVSVQTVARWARDAESRGIAIVPASAALAN